MIHGRVARLAWLVLFASTVAAQAAATSPECPRWREAFAGMPTKMITIQVGARTLALRAKAARSPCLWRAPCVPCTCTLLVS